MTKSRPHWWPAYVGIGSNLDNPREQVLSAFKALGAIGGSRLIRQSSLYHSPPLDGSDQPDYVNAAAGMLTQLEPEAFLHELQAIEKQRGRVRDKARWAARTLDLDLLVFGSRKICNDQLTVPHPGIANRSFVLMPLRDVAPTLRIPGLAAIPELLRKLESSEHVKAVPDNS
ncbi:MAG: 2-amino-4-hydroxy-6-hydroxymethyldihydropteridine diphosphokinase [Woeseiaceae bacterium]